MALTLSLNLQKVGAGETAIDAAGTKNYSGAVSRTSLADGSPRDNCAHR
ncbi:MAG: hypothetical protein WBH09_09590 [Rugosibacter sp.]